MNNCRIDFTSTGREQFNTLLGISFENAPGYRASYFAVKDKTLILMWERDGKDLDSKNGELLDHALYADEAAKFAWDWLQLQKYEDAPLYQGRSEKGYRIFSEPWGSVLGMRYGICGIRPAWITYT